MRRPSGILMRISIQAGATTTTMRDEGYWSVRRLQAAARRAGVAIYLNRFEGIAVRDLVEAQIYASEKDSIFSKKIPSSSYSWIILDQSLIRKIELDA